MLMTGAVFVLAWGDSGRWTSGHQVSEHQDWRHPVWGQRIWSRDVLTAGVIMPAAIYLLLRLLVDLSGPAMPTGCGFVLLLGGGAIAIVSAWCGACHPDIDGSVAHLCRRQVGLGMAGTGLMLIARNADLPGSASFALTATLVSVITGSVSGVLASLAVRAIGVSAGTCRLRRLGGLVHTMPATSAALAGGLLGLSAIPPGIGFASLWLMFQAILSAPRTGGLLSQLPLALIAGGLALSAALTSVALLRLTGVALLGKPRTPRGAAAYEGVSPSRTILLIVTGLSVLTGLLPGPLLWLPDEPAIRALTGAPPGVHAAAFVSMWGSPGFAAVPVVALLTMATGAVILAARWPRRPGKTAGLWAEGMAPPAGLPFGDPAAQSVGEGFLPTLPAILVAGVPMHWLATFRLFTLPRLPLAGAGLWLLLAGFGTLLLLLAVTG
jgi:NADH:ubiquinone oxidoreductase subunit 5 (subunit L)/multisubunit Na+/H+ antiporter MnhA subunit